eukprot:CAMPEP_0119275648 /NCGR_PEP_ID=MMETSP1329-20130426/14130_1 /TAXON_ID=114041 /ORGANISM="Genus nov. species nov., Strain RCC1024" /LENGTH=184 /DNA_ID=CAMNT_0007276043 /DNA_START=447 /DNA_END=1001 /DNA_ORIENTATION=+
MALRATILWSAVAAAVQGQCVGPEIGAPPDKGARCSVPSYPLLFGIKKIEECACLCSSELGETWSGGFIYYGSNNCNCCNGDLVPILAAQATVPSPPGYIVSNLAECCPTAEPSATPSLMPSAAPSRMPSAAPSGSPSAESAAPTDSPSAAPTTCEAQCLATSRRLRAPLFGYQVVGCDCTQYA